MARHRSREHALQLIFQHDLRPAPHDEILKGYYGSLLVSEESTVPPRPDPFAESLFFGATANLTAVDAMITKHAEHWRLERMPSVDRNILRLAVYELLFTETPPAVVIDEALELTKKFSGDEAVHFVNGVVDAVRREMVAVQATPGE
jgi:N utilization substance protein B